MSRLTGTDALGLYEAYTAVYAPQEISEEQIWEEVENWVNSLLEEGYDLSEYTWEDMYESYVNEAGGWPDAAKPRFPAVTVPMPSSKSTSVPDVFKGNSALTAMRDAAAKDAASKVFKYPNKPAPTRPAAPAGRAPAPAGGNRPTPSTLKQAPAAPAKPAAPAPGTKAAGPESIKPKTRNPLMDRTFGYQTGNAPDQQQARADKIVQSGAVKALAPTPSAAPKPAAPANKATGSKKPGSIVAGFDMFDVVLGYLLDEGYANSEDAAYAIMANMSEDWKISIINEARAEGVKAYRPTMTQAEVRANEKEARRKHVEKSKHQKGYGEDEKFTNWKDKATPTSTLKRKGGETETVSQRMDREKPYGKRMTGPLARRMGSRAAANVDRVVTGAGEPQAVTYPRKQSKVSKEVIRKESHDIYDLVLSHLINEGYANTVEEAEGIMMNMSEQWVESIIG